MSLLPQRKKSAEEIAKLRESLGIDVPPDALEEPQPVASVEISPSVPLAPFPVADPPEAKPVRSLRRAERIPVLPIEESGPPPTATHEPEQKPLPVPAPLPVAHGPKMVRSLKKSEQGPLPELHPPEPDSKLPIHRHDDRELNEIRRQAAISNLAAPVHPQSLTAHIVLIAPGYLFALAGAVCFYFYDLEMAITAACVAVALLVAAIIYLKKPLSRHHAAFIGAIALFVIVFGALHYFPQLQHGT